jgi:hypothetical protein
MPTYVCPKGHWWKQRGGKVADCICGAEGKENQHGTSRIRQERLGGREGEAARTEEQTAGLRAHR